MNPDEKQLADSLGCAIENVESIRRDRLKPHEHYTPEVRGNAPEPITYTEAGREAVRLRVLAGVVKLKVVRRCPNRTWIEVESGGICKPVRVRDNQKIRPGSRLLCCELPDLVEVCDPKHLPLKA